MRGRTTLAKPARGRGRQLWLLLAVLRPLVHHWCTLEELIERVGVSRRTIWRVLAELRQAGILRREMQLDARWTAYFRLDETWWRLDATPRRTRTRSKGAGSRGVRRGR